MAFAGRQCDSIARVHRVTPLLRLRSDPLRRRRIPPPGISSFLRLRVGGFGGRHGGIEVTELLQHCRPLCVLVRGVPFCTQVLCLLRLPQRVLLQPKRSCFRARW